MIEAMMKQSVKSAKQKVKSLKAFRSSMMPDEVVQLDAVVAEQRMRYPNERIAGFDSVARQGPDALFVQLIITGVCEGPWVRDWLVTGDIVEEM